MGWYIFTFAVGFQFGIIIMAILASKKDYRE